MEVEHIGTNELTIVVILLVCVVIALIFAYFFRINEFPQTSTSLFGLKQRSMVKVQNPFVLSIHEDNSKLQDGISLSLSALCPSTIVAIWGPKIKPFHEFILLPGSKIRSSCLYHSDNMTDLEALHIETLRYKDPGKHILTLPCPEVVSSSSLGDMPRQRYPLAILVLVSKSDSQTEHDQFNRPSNMGNLDSDIRPSQNIEGEYDSESDTDEEPNSIIGLISIFHLKDEIVAQSSHVIAQYVKTAGLAIYSLQSLYMPNSAPESTSPPSPTTPGSQNSNKPLETNDSLDRDSKEESQPLVTEYPNSDDNNRPSNETGAGCNSIPNSANLTEAEGHLNNLTHSSLSQTENGKTVRKRLPTKLQGCDDNQEGENGTNLASSLPSRNVHYRDNNSHSASPNNHESDNDMETATTANLSECVVCQSKSVGCVILPCRHTCVCLRCLKLLNRCPMCRGAIDSFFGLSKDDGEDGESEEDELIEGMQRDAVAWNVTMYLERLNEMLGFR